jgi:hypothetical protein
MARDADYDWIIDRIDSWSGWAEIAQRLGGREPD